MPDYIPIPEVAAKLGVSVAAVHRAVDSGLLQATYTPGGHRRVTQQAIDQYKASLQAAVAVRVDASDATRILFEELNPALDRRWDHIHRQYTNPAVRTGFALWAQGFAVGKQHGGAS